MNKTLEQTYPQIYKELLNIKSKLEQHFKDAMYIDFSIQEGKLYILGCNPAKPIGVANVIIYVDLLKESIISPNEMIKRISFENIVSYLMLSLTTSNKMTIFSSGQAASTGVCTGVLVRCKEDLKTISNKYILVKNEFYPNDIDLLKNSEGIVTQRGSITSHAADAARKYGKPCIMGCGDLVLSDNYISNSEGDKINVGRFITIDGTSGIIYKGKWNIQGLNWKLDPYMRIIFTSLRLAIRTSTLPHNHIGECWRIWDYFIHHIMSNCGLKNKQPVHTPLQYTSFVQPDNNTISEIWTSLMTINNSDIREYTHCIQGLRRTICRLMSNKTGIGNHYKYYRPFFDPQLCIQSDNSHNCYRQLVGEEFYNISKSLPFLSEIDRITIFFENSSPYKSNLCFLDFTNPRGESIVDPITEISKFKIIVNGALVTYKDLPLFYHSIRKKEYFHGN